VNFSTFSVSIQEKFGDGKISEKAKEVLRLPKESALLRNKNYSAKVFAQHRHQRQIVDSDVLEQINLLRYKKDWVDLTLLVGLAVGSRLIEILKVSTFETAEHPNYIKVIGVAKDRNDKEIKEAHLHLGVEEKIANSRTFVKPILGGILSDELIEIVDKIRVQFSDQHGIDLGFEEHEGRQHRTRKQLTNLADKRVNDKIREIFGQEYTFHDSRAIYAQLAFIQFAPQGISQTAYYSEVLGHSENSLTTALSYQKFAIRRKLEEVDADMKAQVTTLTAEFKAFKEGEKNKDLNDMNPPSIQHVYFQGSDNKTFSILKQVRVRDKDDDARMKRLLAVVHTIEQHGLRPSFRMLNRLGFGGRIINKWSKQKKFQGAEEKKVSS
jgi:hypothetical protein